MLWLKENCLDVSEIEVQALAGPRICMMVIQVAAVCSISNLHSCQPPHPPVCGVQDCRLCNQTVLSLFIDLAQIAMEEKIFLRTYRRRMISAQEDAEIAHTAGNAVDHPNCKQRAAAHIGNRQRVRVNNKQQLL